jgi:hypothetical protein
MVTGRKIRTMKEKIIDFILLIAIVGLTGLMVWIGSL